MALGGAPIGWDEASPPGSESVGLGDDRIRSFKTSARPALDSEHYWTSSSSTAGAHRSGSARAFWGTQSQVSTSGDSYSAGRMMITSNTSRLMSVASTIEGVASGVSAFMLASGPLGLSAGSMVGIALPQTANLVTYFGEQTSAASTHQVVFPAAYNGIPFVLASANSETLSGNKVGKFVRLIGISASEFSVQCISSENGDAIDSGIIWFSIGTRTL